MRGHEIRDDLRVSGFDFAAVSCGMKKNDLPDLALIYSQVPASVAGVFTRSRMMAAPVLLDRQRLRFGKARAILANAGCANACTGPEGYEAAVMTSRWAAQALDLREEEIFVASTGVIGTSLPLDRIQKGIQKLTGRLQAGGLLDVARAIMTTDTRPKWTIRLGEIGGMPFRIAAVAKGAGMIYPQMATLLCFVVTDASIPGGPLQKALEAGLDTSFLAITVDGDTSTNDTILILANGASGAPPLEEGSKDARVFTSLLEEVLSEMALAVVQDAEGATKLIHLQIEGAGDPSSARRVACAIAHSPLVKTAFYGQEVNWGRILAAIGYSGVEVDSQEIDLWYDEVQLVRSGQSAGPSAEDAAQGIARKKEFTVRVSLGAGEGRAIMHTCDLSHDYVTINASYKS